MNPRRISSTRSASRWLLAFVLTLFCSLTAVALLAGPASAAEEGRGTDTTIECRQNGVIVIGETVTCTVFVRDPGLKNPTPPTGTVLFRHTGEGNLSSGSCELQSLTSKNDRETCQVNYTPIGLHPGQQTIFAEYLGDDSHAGSEGSNEFTVFLPIPTTTKLECAPTGLGLKGLSKCVATVTNDPPLSFIEPTGFMAFKSANGNSFNPAFCLVQFVDENTSRCETTFEATRFGPDTLTADYDGDTQPIFSHLKSSGATGVEVGDTTATTVSCLPAGVKPGEPTTCRATVQDTSANPVAPGGTVRFEHDLLGTFSPTSCTLAGNGPSASCQVTYTPTARGFHNVTAAYQGEVGHFASKGSTRLRVGELRFAAPGGTGADPCANPADPCSLFDAADFRGVDSTIQPGDEVVMGPGTYTDAAGDLGPTGVLLPEGRIEIHGQKELPRPRIELLTESGLVTVNQGDLLSGIEIDSAVASADLESLGTVQDTIVRSSAPDSIACVQIAGLIRDSACLSSGPRATAAGTRVVAALGVAGASMRNVTAVATGEASRGLAFDLSGFGGALTYKFDAKATIAKGTAQDVFARNGAEAKAEVQLDHSDYATTLAEGGATITPAGGATNLKAAPQLAADGIHQLAGSPTIDAGATDELSGESDLDGNVRVFGPAADIGADEQTSFTRTAVSCKPVSVSAGHASTCTATVENVSAGVPGPNGVVGFSREGGGDGSFSGSGTCQLTEAEGKFTCQVEYVPTTVGSGSHGIVADYEGDPTHERSSGSTAVSVVNHSTRTTLSCAPVSVEAKHPSHCKATVEDTAAVAVTSPAGKVAFASDSNGAFSATECALTANGDGRSASCAVDYTPAEVQSGHHKLSAAYGSDDIHASSAGQFSLAVTAEGGGGGGEKHPTATTINCEPATISVAKSVQCVIDVNDTAPAGATGATGTVHLHTADPGVFAPADCVLLPSESQPGESACLVRVDYTPSLVGGGIHRLEATFLGDETHTTSTSSPFVLTVDAEGGGKAHPTRTTLSCAPASVEAKHPSHCRATVEDTLASGASAPKGKLTFASDSNGAFSARECDLTPSSDGRTATCAFDYTPAEVQSGHHKLSAAYGSDTVHISSAGETSLTVTAEGSGGNFDATKTTLACVPASLAVGGSSTCTATVTDEAASPSTPRGSVSFTHTNEGVFSPQASCALVGGADGKSASCQLAYNPTAAGAHQLTGVYTGDEAHTGSEGGASLSVSPVGGNRDATKTTLACVPASLAVGGSATCTATVTDEANPSSTPLGNVSFSHTNEGVFSPQASCTLTKAAGGSSASCQLTYNPTGAGAHQLTALYSGDEAHTSSQENTSLSVTQGGGNRDATKATLACAPPSPAVGGSSTCTATVTDEAASPSTPRGNVSFTHTNEGVFSPQASCALIGAGDGRTASCQLTYIPSAIGAHQLTGAYSGDEGHVSSEASTSLSVAQGGGNRDATETTVACEPASLALGGSSICTATVSDEANPSNTPLGNVSFSHTNDGVFSPQASCSLIKAADGKSASCQLNYNPTAAGAHQLTALYSGDEAHASSQASTSLSVAQGGGNRDATRTTLICGPSSLPEGAATTCTATVTDEAASPSTPRGSFVFTHVNEGVFSPQASCVLVAAGNGRSASCHLTYIPTAAGAHQLTSAYSGDEAHASSEASTGLSVSAAGANRDQTRSTLACEPSSLPEGAASSCTATVTDEAASPSTPRGSFSFSHSSEGVLTPQASCVLIGAGDGKSASCQLTYIPTAEGAHLLTSVYSGDEGHAGSEASTVLTATRGAAGTNQTSTAVQCLPASRATSEASTCTATVSDETASPSVPSGTVEFATNGAGAFSDAASCTLSAVAGTTASCQVTYRPILVGAGSHRITGTYQGDAGHLPSQGTDQIEVTAESPELPQTGTALACAPSAVKTSEASTCTVTVIDESATPSAPSGTVEFATNGVGAFSDAAVCTLAPAGADKASCDLTYIPIEVGGGHHKVFATYEADGSHRISQGTATIDVTAETPELPPTRTALVCAPASRATGEPSTCIANVENTGAAPSAPSGTVEFASNGAGDFSATSCTLDGAGGSEASCEVEYTPTAVGGGQHRIVATYLGDAEHRLSQGTDAIAVTPPPPHPTRTVVSCEPAQISLDGVSACSVTVVDISLGVDTAPSGEVRFANPGGGSFSGGGACTLFPIADDKSHCQLVFTPGAEGNQAVEAGYQGDAGHTASAETTQVAVSAANGGHPTATSLSCEPASVLVGGASICTVEVSDTAADPQAPGGGVVFASEGPGTFGTGGCILFAVTADKSRCQVIYTPIEAGAAPHSLVAIYPGEEGHKPSTASTQLLVSARNGGHRTTTALDCQPPEVAVGASTSCTATVTDFQQADATTPTGGVVFGTDSAGTFDQGGCHLEEVSPGKASCHLAYSPVDIRSGSHELVAAYEGDAGQEGVAAHEPSRDTARVAVTPPPLIHLTQAAVDCTPNPAAAGSPVTCTAVVADAAANPTAPTGAVKFATDGQGKFSAASCTLIDPAAGRATCQVTYTPGAVGSGSHKVTATYQGDGSHAASEGNAQVQVSAAPGSPGSPPPPAPNPRANPGPQSAPNTTLKKKPRRKTAVHKAKFRFVADQAGSTFQCKVDKKAFRRCRSPFKRKVRAGRHTFKVRAVNPQGLVDPTPAVFHWRVGRVKKR